MTTSESDFINQSIVAQSLNLSVADALDLLSRRGYWDKAGHRPTDTALGEGLARMIEHPLTGNVTMWSRQVLDRLVPAETPAQPSDAALAGGVSSPANSRTRLPAADQTIEIFIASSIDEFGAERSQIAGVLHSVDRRFAVYLAEYDPDGDSQESINRHLESAEYFVAIIGRRLGEKTGLEIDLAMRHYREQGAPRIKFFIQKFADNHTQRSPEVEQFARELFEEGVHYPREFADQQELIDQVELFFRRLRK